MRPIEEQIDLYIKGKLSKEDAEKFEKQLREDSELSKEFELQRMAKIVVLKDLKQQNLKHFDQLGSELLAQGYKRNWLYKLIERLKNFFQLIWKKFFRIDLDSLFARRLATATLSLGITVVVLAFTGIGYVSFFADSQFKDANEALAILTDKDISPLNSNVKSSGRSLGDSASKTQVPDSLSLKMHHQAIRSYNQGDFKSAQESFLNIQDDSISKSIELPLAIAYVKTKKFQKAKDLLEDYNPQSPTSDQYRWYLILSLLGLDEKEELKKELCSYIDQAFIFNFDEAKKLRKTLKIRCE